MKASARLEKIKWRSVLTRMPEPNALVLIYAPKEETPVWIGYFSRDDQECWLYDNSSKVNTTVTHWAELPKGPWK